jgi:hypothetical protein
MVRECGAESDRVDAFTNCRKHIEASKCSDQPDRLEPISIYSGTAAVQLLAYAKLLPMLI